MPIVVTDLRNTRESARELRFEPTGSISATNTQKAIEEVASESTPVVTWTPVTATPYAVTTERYLAVNVAAPAEIRLPAAASRGGLPLVAKDVSGDASTNNITITPDGAETIDGLAEAVIYANYGGFEIVPNADGTGWSITP